MATHDLNPTAPQTLATGPNARASELANALTLLNRNIVPQPQVQSDLHTLTAQSKAATRSHVQIVRALLLHHDGLTLLSCELSKTSAIDLVKFFDRTRAVPLLASAGHHLSASLGAANKHIFAQAFGLHLTPGQTIDIEMRQTDGKLLGAQLQVVPLNANSVQPLLLLATGGQAALANLIKQDVNPQSPLRRLANTLSNLDARQAQPYVGKVDDIIGGVIEGWVWCPAKPQNRYEVQAYCEGRLVGYATANQWREDLERNHKADGRLKFELPLAKTLFNGQTHRIQLRIVGQAHTPQCSDITTDWGEALVFHAPDRFYNAEQAAMLMGYDIDQKVAQALVQKSKNPKLKDAVTQFVPKISLHLANFEISKARQIIRDAIQACGTNGFFELKMAESHLMEADYSTAEHSYRKMANKAPRFVWAHLGLAHCLHQLGQKADAIAALQAATKLAPDYAPAQALLQQLQHQEALEALVDAHNPAPLENTLNHAEKQLLANPHNMQLSQSLQQLYAIESSPNTPNHGHLTISFQEDDYPEEAKALRHARILLTALLNHCTESDETAALPNSLTPIPPHAAS